MNMAKTKKPKKGKLRVYDVSFRLTGSVRERHVIVQTNRGKNDATRVANNAVAQTKIGDWVHIESKRFKAPILAYSDSEITGNELIITA